MLAVAGVLAAVAIVRLPGRSGHLPYEGIKAGTAKPAELPGILPAALATPGLGGVRGAHDPEPALAAEAVELKGDRRQCIRGRLPGQIVTVRTAKAQQSFPAARLVACHVQQ